MNHALHALGLGSDADERAIKRAYAAKLKTTRPDSDPEGFQALNAAYQAALEWVRSQALEDLSQVIAAPAVPADALPGPTRSQQASSQQDSSPDLGENDSIVDHHDRDDTDVHAPAGNEDGSAFAEVEAPSDTIRFDLDAFFESCVALAVRSRDGELLGWLNAQPILWSLEHKTPIAHWLLRHLNEIRPPIEARRFDVLADFFGLLDLNSGYDAYVIHRLRHRLHLAWEVQTEQLRALAQRAGMDGGSVAADIRQTRRILQQLRRPMNIAQILFAGLMPMYPSAVRRFLRRLDFGNLDDLPAPIEPAQVAFWEAAGDRSRFSAPRLQIGAMRCLAYAAIGVLVVLLVKALTPGTVIDPAIALKTGTTLLAGLFAGWLAWLGGQATLEWQCLPQDGEERFGRSRWALIPMLALLAVVLDSATPWNSIATAVSMTSCVLAWHRYRQRNGPLFDSAPRGRLWSALGFLLAFGVVLVLLDRAPHLLVGGISALAVTLWAADLRKQRGASES